MRYLPHSSGNIRAMLDRIGVSEIDDLFDSVPPDQLRKSPLELEPSLDEAALMDHVEKLSSANRRPSTSFLGAGAYDHHIPPAVDQLLLRSEFYTAYTPYQPEVAQGTLQSIFEFQTTVCELFGMEVANASMYDGASATAEAALMARRVTGRDRIVVSEALHPHYRETLQTYLRGLAGGDEPDLDLVPVRADGSTDLERLAALTEETTAAVIIGYPNFFGTVEDLPKVQKLADQAGALLVVANWEPYAMGALAPPGSVGADIVVGEGQALAVPPQYGGPGVGLFACRKKHVRQMPGRVVGSTVDQHGARGYVLTLSTREQHIRRERATSNICTNHGLIALAFTIRAALLGRQGLIQISRLCLSRAEYLKGLVRNAPNLELVNAGPTFNEVTLRRKDRAPAKAVLARLADAGIDGGVALEPWFPERQSEFLVAITERNSKEDIDALVQGLDR